MLAEQNLYPDGYLDTDVYVENAGADISGYVVHRAAGQMWHFDNLVGFAAVLEGLCNACDYPQATHVLRRLDDAAASSVQAQAQNSDEYTKTHTPQLSVRLEYRAKASWQGCVIFPDGGRRAFHSALELLRIIGGMASPSADGVAPRQ